MCMAPYHELGPGMCESGESWLCTRPHAGGHAFILSALECECEVTGGFNACLDFSTVTHCNL